MLQLRLVADGTLGDIEALAGLEIHGELGIAKRVGQFALQRPTTGCYVAEHHVGGYPAAEDLLSLFPAVDADVEVSPVVRVEYLAIVEVQELAQRILLYDGVHEVSEVVEHFVLIVLWGYRVSTWVVYVVDAARCLHEPLRNRAQQGDDKILNLSHCC